MTAPHSAVVALSSDWNGADGAARAYLTAGTAPTEETYQFFSGSYTSYGIYYPDVGNSGTATIGFAAPSGQKYTMAALEILAPAATSGAVSAVWANIGSGAVQALGTKANRGGSVVSASGHKYG